MPTSRKARAVLLGAVPPESKLIFELGSGWGHLLFPLARRFPGAQIYGYELSFFPYLISRSLLFFKPYPNLHIQRKNFYSLSLTPADCVICYLYPGAMQKLKSKFENELSEGAHILSNSFTIPNWIPVTTLNSNDFWKSEILVYKYSKK